MNMANISSFMRIFFHSSRAGNFIYRIYGCIDALIVGKDATGLGVVGAAQTTRNYDCQVVDKSYKLWFVSEAKFLPLSGFLREYGGAD